MRFSATKKFTAFFTLLALFSPIFSVANYSRDYDGDTERKRLTNDQKILHVLNRLGFGAKPGDIRRVKQIGLEAYIDQQLNPELIADKVAAAKIAKIDILKMSSAEIFAKYPRAGALLRKNTKDRPTDQNARRKMIRDLYQKYDLRRSGQIMSQIQSARILRAAYSERQLEEVMVDFWSNHFNVYSGKSATRTYIPSYERDVIRKNALGTFKDLVVGTAKHPAMLFYLDNFSSVAPATNNNQNRRRAQRSMKNGQLNPKVRERLKKRGLSDEQIDARLKQIQNGGGNRNRRGINENYARELMELHTLGVDGGYTQEDIKEVAKAFTGWTIFDSRGYKMTPGGMEGGNTNRQLARQARQLGISPNTESGTFIFADKLHDKGAKTVLGKKITAGGMRDGLQVIDILVSHPSTAKFIAKKLAVKFVSDNPSDGLVSRIAKTFSQSNGDIKTTLRALFTDKEFFAPENYRAKIKTPFELMISSMRAVNMKTDGSPGLIALLNRMGEPLYGYIAPTGYPDTAADWVNTGALLERMNFAVALASNRIPRTQVNLKKFNGASKSQILERSIAGILHDEISSKTKETLMKQLDNPLPEPTLETSNAMNDDGADSEMMMENRRGRGRNRSNRLRKASGDPEVFKIVSLILGSPEFQRQ